MAIDSDTSLLSYYKNSYYVKLKEFRKGLVSHSQLLGYTLILIAQIKFAGNIILFIVRMGVQSLLGSPYGTKTQLDTVLSNYRQQWSSNDEADTKVKQFLRKSQVALLHLSLTLNFMVIVSGVIWPFDFESQLEHFKMPGIAHLENTPSAFNYRYNVIEGELRRNWFTQYIGERIPASNFRGNCSYLFYQLLILFAQLGLYLITVIELSPFNKTDDETLPDTRSDEYCDGYNGKIVILETDPKSMLESIIDGKQVEEEVDQLRTDSIV